MSRFAKLFAANAIAAAGLGAAALALSPAAVAEPAITPAVPGVPALNMIQQFATNPASFGAVLQTAATALNGASQMVGAPAPSTLPVSPIEGAPGTAPLSPLTPAAAPVAPAATLTDPAAALAPLLGQLGFPANLVNLGPADMPFPIQIAGTTPTAPVAPVAAPLAPVLPAAPAGAAVNPLPLLNALP